MRRDVELLNSPRTGDATILSALTTSESESKKKYSSNSIRVTQAVLKKKEGESLETLNNFLEEERGP